MKRRLVALVGVSCIASLIASGVYAKGKPDKPGGPEIERISFVGDLGGRQLVVGCCPNAGPWPEYSMTLSLRHVDDDLILQGTYDGHLFMNGGPSRGKKPGEYKVQFWTDEFFFEICGGEIDSDQKSKNLTARFTNEPGTVILIDGSEEPPEIPVIVSFVLTRTRL